MKKTTELRVQNPCIPKILPCNNCITLSICKSFLNSTPELIFHYKGRRGWLDSDLRQLIYNDLMELSHKCSDLYYYLQPYDDRHPMHFPPVDGWRLTNIYSVLSYLNMKLFVEYQETIIRQTKMKYLAREIRNRLTF